MKSVSCPDVSKAAIHPKGGYISCGLKIEINVARAVECFPSFFHHCQKGQRELIPL